MPPDTNPNQPNPSPIPTSGENSSGILPPKQSVMRTFRTDIASEIETKNITQTDIALAEEKRRRSTGAARGGVLGQGFQIPSLKTVGAVIVALFALLFLVAFVYDIVYPDAPETAGGLTPPEPIIFAEKSTQVDLSATKSLADAEKVIGEARNAVSGKKNTLEYLYFSIKNGSTEQILDAQSFFSALLPQAPSPLVRSLGRSFLYGVYTSSEKSPFLLLSLDSYESAYAGMLTWEERLHYEIIPLLGGNPNEQLAGSLSWKDDTLRNTDIRREVDAGGNSILLYSFLDRKTLLITQSDVVFYEVLGRLHTPKPVTQ
ncbi:MAG: hypothetical protein V4674_01870 [Patescibacteria group bacterium]